jgi:hypothetical protein
MLWWCEFSLASLTRWQSIVILCGAAVGAPIAGVFVGIWSYQVVQRLVFDPERFIARRNGGPFGVGDSVAILRGPHRGRTVQVYEVTYGQGGRPYDVVLRVNLGEDERAACTDMFRQWEVLRA